MTTTSASLSSSAEATRLWRHLCRRWTAREGAARWPGAPWTKAEATGMRPGGGRRGRSRVQISANFRNSPLRKNARCDGRLAAHTRACAPCIGAGLVRALEAACLCRSRSYAAHTIWWAVLLLRVAEAPADASQAASRPCGESPRGRCQQRRERHRDCRGHPVRGHLGTSYSAREAAGCVRPPDGRGGRRGLCVVEGGGREGRAAVELDSAGPTCATSAAQ